MNRFGKRIVIIVGLAALVAGCAADGSDDDPSASSEAATDDATSDGTPDDDSSESDASGATDEDGEASEDPTEGEDAAESEASDDAPEGEEGSPSLATESTPVGTDTLDPVPAFEEAPFGDGLIATVTEIEDVELEGMGPGETSGPGILVSLEMRNDSSEDIDLTGLVVNASYDGGTPAIPNTSTLTSPFSDPLAPGESRDGVYAFRVPPKQAGSVQVEIQHNASANIVVIQL